MKQRRIVRRLLALLLSAIMTVALLPAAGLGGKAQAATATWTKTVAGLGTSIIKAPKAPEDKDSPWTGSYVWYGRYNGKPVKYRVLAPVTTAYGGTTMLLDCRYNGKPVKYRVLAPVTTAYGGTTMLLDCDSLLYSASFDEDGRPNAGAQYSNEWAFSDIRAGLNGDAFLTAENVFSDIERNAIAPSRKSGRTFMTDDLFEKRLGAYASLTGEKVFLLEFEDVMNPEYGYVMNSGLERDPDGGEGAWKRVSVPNRVKKISSSGKSWYLRCGEIDEDRDSGMVYYNGGVYYEDESFHDHVSPAFNVDLSAVIFSSVVSGTAGEDNAEYKLTIADTDLKIGIQSGKTLTASGKTITVPYKITGNDASNATQVSVLILDKPYTAGNANGAKIKYYSKLDTGADAGFSTTGTGTFTLSSGVSVTDWLNSKYYIYLLAEDVNDIHETDYASVPARVFGPDAPNINTQPADITVTVGNTAKFTVNAVGIGTFMYQWQCKAPTATSWSNSTQTGAKTATLSVSTNVNHHGYQYRCVVTASNGRKAVSEAATLSIKSRITTQPADRTVSIGEVASFSVAVTGKTPFSYQWQYRSPGSTSWKNSTQSGAATAKLSVKATVNHNGYQYRCVVTDGNGMKTYSSVATLRTPAIETHPSDRRVAVGSVAKFSVTASGDSPLHYQWQYKSPGAASWKDSTQSGATGATLSVTTNVNHNGYQYRCVVSDANGKTVTSNAATLTILPRITAQPKNAGVYFGETATFSVTATGKATLQYRWQYKIPGTSSWKNSTQNGATTTKLSMTATDAHNGYQYRCVVTDGNGNKSYSSAAVLTVTSVITKQPSSVCTDIGTKVTFSVETAAGASYTYQWQYRTPYASAWTDSTQSGAKTSKLSFNATVNHQSYQYRCVVTESDGRQSISEVVTLTLCNIPITETYFPDSVFREYVRTTFDTVSDDVLSAAEIAEVKIIKLHRQDIENLKGVEFFTELEQLGLNYNKLTSLDVSRNRKLTKLWCGDNTYMQSLDVRGCSQLSYLYCSFSGLKSLDVTRNTALTNLYCGRDHLTKLNVSKNTALVELECWDNSLETLDISKNPALVRVTCDRNGMKTLIVGNHEALTFLRCYDNQLTTVDASGCTNPAMDLTVDAGVEVIGTCQTYYINPTS